MAKYQCWKICSLATLLIAFSSINATEETLPKNFQQIMGEAKYEHSLWGIYVKDLETGKILFDLNSEKLFSPASTTKLFSIASLLHAFGDEYRFKTPVFASVPVKNGELQGDLILVGQGDLTLGGRQPNANTISFTKLDHINANEIPGVILTKEDPLHGLNELAKGVYQSGIREVTGDVLIDDSLFETTEKRGMILSPIMLNENLIDIVINPSELDKAATITWRPEVPGYTVENQVKTVAKDDVLEIEVTADKSGHNIVVKGTVPVGQQDLIRTFSIQDPKTFARAAFIQALRNQGVKLTLPAKESDQTQIPSSYKDLQQVALWTSPPLSEYAKLVLKVSHNLGANLVPLLLASQHGKKTFDEGMRLLGDFVTQEVKLSPDTFVLIDGAGGNENRFTPQAEIQLLSFIHKQKPVQFQHFFDALPILGVDGSLEDFGKKTDGVGKVRAKPGTGVALNLATGKLFLITQALGGYIEGKNGNLFAYMVVVNNATMPTIDDVFAIFEDESRLSSLIYSMTGNDENAYPQTSQSKKESL